MMEWEQCKTETEFQLSKVTKLSFITISITVLQWFFIFHDTTRWYEPGQLLETAFYSAISAWLACTRVVVRLSQLFWAWRRRSAAVTQAELDVACQPPVMDLAGMYS